MQILLLEFTIYIVLAMTKPDIRRGRLRRQLLQLMCRHRLLRRLRLGLRLRRLPRLCQNLVRRTRQHLCNCDGGRDS